MRVFARFEMSTGKCVGSIASSDPSVKVPEFYEEIVDPVEKEYVLNRQCKKITLPNGRRKIVLL